MKVLLYGCGAVGLGIAATVYDSEGSVDLIAKGKTKEAIMSQGIIRKGMFKEIRVPSKSISIYEKLEEISNKRYDYILICTKSTSNGDTTKELNKHRELLKEAGKIVLFQNGWGNDEPFLEYFNKNQVYSARVITGFKRPERNISEITVHASPMLIGSLYGEELQTLAPLAKAINDGGIPCEITEDVGKALWAKMLYNCTLNPLGAVLGVAYGKLTESENSVFIMNKIIEEIFSVMTAAGFNSYWESAAAYKNAFYEELVPTTYKHRSSTLQDIERKIKTEIDSLNGSIVRLGNKFNIDVPYNTMIYNMIKALESYF